MNPMDWWSVVSSSLLSSSISYLTLKALLRRPSQKSLLHGCISVEFWFPHLTAWISIGLRAGLSDPVLPIKFHDVLLARAYWVTGSLRSILGRVQDIPFLLIGAVHVLLARCRLPFTLLPQVDPSIHHPSAQPRFAVSQLTTFCHRAVLLALRREASLSILPDLDVRVNLPCWPTHQHHMSWWSATPSLILSTG